VLPQSCCFIWPDIKVLLWLYEYLLWSHQQPSAYISWQSKVMISSLRWTHTIHINEFVTRNNICGNEYMKSLNYAKVLIQKMLLYLLPDRLSIDLNINVMKMLLLLYIILRQCTDNDSSHMSVHNFANMSQYNVSGKWHWSVLVLTCHMDAELHVGKKWYYVKAKVIGLKLRVFIRPLLYTFEPLTWA
jgi:hypothetical protein